MPPWPELGQAGGPGTVWPASGSGGLGWISRVYPTVEEPPPCAEEPPALRSSCRQTRGPQTRNKASARLTTAPGFPLPGLQEQQLWSESVPPLGRRRVTGTEAEEPVETVTGK